MLDAGWGRIIAVASTAGLKGYPYVAALLRRQARRHRPDPRARARDRQDRRHRQRRLPRLRADTDAGALDRDDHRRRPAARAPRPRRRSSPPTRRAASSSRTRSPPPSLWLCSRRRRLGHRPGDLDLGRRDSEPLDSRTRRQRRKDQPAPLAPPARGLAHHRGRAPRAPARAFDTTLPRFDVMAALYRAAGRHA